MPARKQFAAWLVVAVCCGSNVTRASDRLTPCTGLLSDYYTRVETLMSLAAPGEALWKVTVFPQRGQGEWSVRATRVDDGYALTVVRFDRSLWDASWSITADNQMHRDASSAQAQPHAITRKISPRLFNELEAQIRQAIAAVGPSESSDVDDVLSMHNPELRFEAGGSCANTRTFRKGTRTYKLTNIVLMLCNPPREDKILRLLQQIER